MIKGFRILMFLLPVLWADLRSQELSHYVLVPMAGVVSDSQIGYSQTVGETAVEITGCSFYIFTQGFQQPDMEIKEDRRDGSGILVYPNPVSDYLTIELFGEKARTFRIEIINGIGHVIRTERKAFTNHFWYREPHYVKDLVSGLYIIRIMSEDGLINRAFRIEKI